jgi:hypothetical protein
MNINLTFIQLLQKVFKSGFIRQEHEFKLETNPTQMKIINEIYTSHMRELCKLIREEYFSNNLDPYNFIQLKTKYPHIDYFMKSNFPQTCFITVNEINKNYINMKVVFTPTHYKIYFGLKDNPYSYFSETPQMISYEISQEFHNCSTLHHQD